MSDTLDQTEIDALLSAVDGGGLNLDDDDDDRGGSGPPPPFGARDAEVQHYDFKRPERVGKEQARALETLHEGFARNLGASLSGFLRTIVEVNVSHIEQLTYSEFIHSLPNPTCFNLLASDQLAGQLCLELSPLIVYPIIDRLLGGSNADLFIPQRPLTQIEQRLVQRVTDRVTHHLGEAWGQVTPVEFAVGDFESNPQLVQIVPPNETVVVVGFEIKLGQRAGTMSLCMPYGAIEPVMSRIGEQTWLSYQGKRDPAAGHADAARLGDGLAAAAVELRATLAKTTITLGELTDLRPGDVLTTDKPAGTGLTTLSLDGRNKFRGKLGKFRGKRAVRVTEILDPSPA